MLAAPDGQIVAANDAAEVGRALTGDERERAITLAVDGRTIGYLTRSGVEAQALDRAQQSFLDEVSGALVVAALVAIALALLLALILAWALLRRSRRCASRRRRSRAATWVRRWP